LTNAQQQYSILVLSFVWSANVTQFPYVKVSGSPSTIGQQLGETFRERISDCFDLYHQIFVVLGANDEQLIDLAKQYAAHIHNELPRISPYDRLS